MDEQRIEELAQRERKEYYKQWRANNRDKIKKHRENYWRKRALQRMQNEEVKND